MSPKAGFTLINEIVPRLISAIPNVVHYVGAEDAHELIQDATCFAAKILHNVEKARKKVTSGNIAYYTIQHIKSGRRSTGSSSGDVYGSQTQLKGRSRLMSLEEVVACDECGGEIFTFNDVLSNDHEDPSTRAGRKMDWEEFVAALPEREQKMIEFMIEGKTLRKAAHVLGVSDSTMHSAKEKLAVKILEFMGSDILVDIRRLPRWRQDIETTREKMACREERRHL